MKSIKQKYEHGFIGMGKMGQVILKGLLGSKITSAKKILVSRRSPKELKRLAKIFHIAITQDNSQVAQQCRYVWLGIKPFQSKKVLTEIASHLKPGTILISMMAGISSQTMGIFLKEKFQIIRLMPNTPALVEKGMTGIYFSPSVTIAVRKRILKILKSLGEILVVSSESKLDAVTGLSGSGPAFVYQFVKGLIQGGMQSKLSATEAKQLAIQTVRGAAEMLFQSKKSPEELIQQVVSKKGTTETGLKVLKKKKMKESIALAVKTATLRAQKIRQENEPCI